MRTPDKKSIGALDGENSYCKFAADSMQGWRMEMEDTHVCHGELGKGMSFFAIFDGHGGAGVAHYCSKEFKNILIDDAEYKDGKYEAALKRAFLKMDERLHHASAQNEVKKHSKNSPEGVLGGCTALVVLLKPPFEASQGKTNTQVGSAQDNAQREASSPKESQSWQGLIAVLGNSRSLLYTKGELVQPDNFKDSLENEVAKEHRPTDPVEWKRILAAGGIIVDGRIDGQLTFSRSLGDLEYKKNPKLKPEEQIISPVPDVKVINLEVANDTFILMGSDGVWEWLQDSQIKDMIQQQRSRHQNLSTVLGELLKNCLAPDTTQGAGCDNMTAIIITPIKPDSKAETTTNTVANPNMTNTNNESVPQAPQGVSKQSAERAAD